MATLVLSSIGGAVAGPMGSAVGSFFGKQIDRQLRGSGGGRRVSDLRIQSSHYGTEVPAIYSRIRVAGTVVWASDLVQTARVSKSGAQHSYSVSFAVALSSRPMRAVGRVWADGRLIRGAGGDHKIFFRMRLAGADEDREPDPLIASAEGLARTPAYRGLSLLIFEDFDLGTFGNRLPQITAEVDAGDGDLTAEGFVGDLLGVPQGASAQAASFQGFALQGETMAEALRPVVEAFRLPFTQGLCGWEVGREPAHHVLASEDLVIKRSERAEAESAVPTSVSVRYFDAATDFSAAEKAARLSGPQRGQRIEFPGVIKGDAAKAIAHDHLAAAWSRQRTVLISLASAKAHGIRLGDLITIAGVHDEALVVTSLRSKGGTSELTLREDAMPRVSFASDEGTIKREADHEPGPVQIVLFELPPSNGSTTHNMAVAVAGGTRPWRRASLEIDAAGAHLEMLSPDLPAITGRLTEVLGGAPQECFDDRNWIEVQIDRDEWLTGANDDDLLAGANLAKVGCEFLQFGIVKALGEGRYRLGRLLRGRCGSRIPDRHEQGSNFVLMTPGRLATFQVPVDAIGRPITARAQDSSGQVEEVSHTFEAGASLPLAPAHLAHSWRGQDLELTWVRRSRTGGAWLDFVDAPLGEAREGYLLTMMGQSGVPLSQTASVPLAVLPEAHVAVLGARPWKVSIRQVGDFGAGPASHLTIA